MPMLLLALVLAACSGGAPEETGASSPPAESTPQQPKEAGAMKEIDPRLESFVAEAASDLARRLKIDEDEIELAEARFVTWPNSALGCPEPDIMYTQALVPGYRIRLIVNGRSHHFHGARDRPPFHCPAERVSAPAARSGESKDLR
jgi:hypothetical protein